MTEARNLGTCDLCLAEDTPIELEELEDNDGYISGRVLLCDTCADSDAPITQAAIERSIDREESAHSDLTGWNSRE